MADKALAGLAAKVREIYRNQPDGAEESMRSLLEKELGHLKHEEQKAQIERLASSFLDQGDDVNAHDIHTLGNDEILTRICSLLLGRKVSQADLSSSDILDRLAESMNTIFDTLNQLVHLIQTTLQGGGTGDETIRQVIGVHLEGDDQRESLESYLGQIKTAFWTAQQAFQKAAHVTLEQVLAELEPEKMKEEHSKGFKFGPMRKAEYFDLFEEKYRKIKKWVDSGQFGEDFLREFERNAQKLSTH